MTKVQKVTILVIKQAYLQAGITRGRRNPGFLGRIGHFCSLSDHFCPLLPAFARSYVTFCHFCGLLGPGSGYLPVTVLHMVVYPGVVYPGVVYPGVLPCPTYPACTTLPTTLPYTVLPWCTMPGVYAALVYPGVYRARTRSRTCSLWQANIPGFPGLPWASRGFQRRI